MNDETVRVRRQRSIYQVHYGLKKEVKKEMAKPIPYLNPGADITAYNSQVAGHRQTENNKYLGLLQCNNGTVMKPILQESQQREVDFYKRVSTSDDPDLVELRKYIPKYFGCKKYTYDGHENEYIILEDLTVRMLEPCVMDVKIGKRTWDPLATPDKIEREKSKYAACKNEYRFCIPGFQVFKLSNGQLRKYGKDYGKKLQGQMVIEAIRTYLNGAGESGVCRALLLQFLAQLWKIQRWASRQCALRLYATSLLLVYDAERVRRCCRDNDLFAFKLKCTSPAPGARRRSIHSMHSVETAGSNFSGQITAKGPQYKRVQSVSTTPLGLVQSSFVPPNTASNSPWSEALNKLHHNHSFDHNYDDKLSKIKMNYRAVLDQLSSDEPTPNWGTVMIIDFAHAFFNDDDEAAVDDNFKEGIDNFVRIFETLLRETDDQVF
ncbi:Inositol polyphosphate multikinase [Eumeta japonica]|uniref:Kinase n=1 Tax=Eumeta variegata TaxID=151549 RepID=A0A4C1TWM8_EUMVA|nr:Inositol polyphosphate multikinase [Eumeta japonica]